MKLISWTLAVVAGSALVLSGCASKSSVDTAPLEKSFASAEPANKTVADKAVSAIKAGDYPGATAELPKLAAQAKLTPEQQQAVKDTLATLQKQLSDVAAKATKDAGKAAGDLQKSLPKP
jgi:DNA-binding NtrC family response regulator